MLIEGEGSSPLRSQWGNAPPFLFHLYPCIQTPIESPSVRRGSSFIVLLPSGSGFVLVREGFEGVSALFSGSREGDSQIFEVSRSFLKIFYHP